MSLCAKKPRRTLSTVRDDANRPDRYRWDVYKIKKLRDSSVYSFATRQEAQTDGELFVGKLVTTWQKPN
jgi:hypothetical protein